MRKVVINCCWGGFSISKQACEEIGIPYHKCREIERDDPKLVDAIEKLGDKANGEYAKLKVVEIPDYVDWEIDEYDGMESVREKSGRWS